jgi:hypothetical protein
MTTATAVREKPMQLWVSRFASHKCDVIRMARWLKSAGCKRITITGKRGLWRVRARSTVLQLAQFAAIEAHYEVNKP